MNSSARPHSCASAIRPANSVARSECKKLLTCEDQELCVFGGLVWEGLQTLAAEAPAAERGAIDALGALGALDLGPLRGKKLLTAACAHQLRKAAGLRPSLIPATADSETEEALPVAG